MANKYHQAIEREVNMNRASSKAGIKFTSLGEMADYNKTLREDAASKVRKVQKPKKRKLPARKGLPTGYDQ